MELGESDSKRVHFSTMGFGGGAGGAGAGAGAGSAQPTKTVVTTNTIINGIRNNLFMACSSSYLKFPLSIQL
jgi:hypothetical protein